MTTMKIDLVGAAEIQERHGIARHRVFRFLRRGLWPAPVASLKSGDVYDAAEVEKAVAHLQAAGLL